MEEHRVTVKIVEALEAEKKKIAKELEDMQKKRTLRQIHTQNGRIRVRVNVFHLNSFS